MKKRVISIILAAVVALSCIGTFRIEVDAFGNYADTSGYDELDEIFDDYFRIGVAVQAIDHWGDQTAEIGNPYKEDLIDRCFNSMTFGNELKPAYNFDPKSETLFTVDPAAEELLIWAKEHDMPVRGHTLVWHSQVNPAVFAKDFKATAGGAVTSDWEAKLDEDCLVSRDELIKRLKTYIYGAIEYVYANGFGDVVYAWDVVNEAVDEKAEGGFRNSYWKKIIGPEFLYYSFLFAREACVKYSREYADLYGIDSSDPDADYSAIMPELFYNDYNEWVSARSNTIVRFLSEDQFNPGQSMVKSDVIAEDGDGTILGDGLIDGIGMQGHLDATQNIEEYTRALEKYDACIGNVHITELDVGIGGNSEAAFAKQALFYYNFFTALMDEVDKGVGLSCITFWGLTDDASWRKGANPLLFNYDLSAKNAYDALVMAGNRQEFEMEGIDAAGNSTNLRIDFEPAGESEGFNIVNLEQLGLTSRGTGHQSKLMLLTVENHTEKANPGYSVKVSRSETDATAKLDLSGFIGEYVKFDVWIKTDDPAVVVGFEGDGGTFELESTSSTGDWQELSGAFLIPKDWIGASLYFETDGSGDMFLDDISVSKLKEDDPAIAYAFDPEEPVQATGALSEEELAEQQAAEQQPDNIGFWDRIVNWFKGLF
ncbi:Endo-1,4-beta-xylanase, GH35 family [Lachnospiraceae bacterium XBB2008]|nr:Endo-1,4-beta-xylanase, GH35 family [Lachnospiraceae bacterium XBB2008]